MTDSDNTPADLGTAGRELWASVADLYELETHEARLLHEAGRTVDLLDNLAAIVAREGIVIDSPTGQRTHPAVVESRQQRLVLGRLLVALRLPAGEEDEAQGGARRPQRRAAFRRPQGITGVVR